MVGWRLWRLDGDSLHSLGARYAWSIGENTAVCRRAEGARCASVPGAGCECGLWALNSPLAAMELGTNYYRLYDWLGVAARAYLGLEPRHRLVLGLVKSFGSIAVHGNEAFRAERASIECLFLDSLTPIFDDRPWHELLAPVWLVDALRRLAGSADPLHRIAARYGVPCTSIETALSTDLLHELGVGEDSFRQLRAWQHYRRKRHPRPKPPTLRLRMA